MFYRLIAPIPLGLTLLLSNYFAQFNKHDGFRWCYLVNSASLRVISQVYVSFNTTTWFPISCLCFFGLFFKLMTKVDSCIISFLWKEKKKRRRRGGASSCSRVYSNILNFHSAVLHVQNDWFRVPGFKHGNFSSSSWYRWSHRKCCCLKIADFAERHRGGGGGLNKNCSSCFASVRETWQVKSRERRGKENREIKEGRRKKREDS